MTNVSIFSRLPTRENCVLVQLSQDLPSAAQDEPVKLLVSGTVVDALARQLYANSPRVLMRCHPSTRSLFRTGSEGVTFRRSVPTAARLVDSGEELRLVMLHFNTNQGKYSYAALQPCNDIEQVLDAQVIQLLQARNLDAHVTPARSHEPKRPVRISRAQDGGLQVHVRSPIRSQQELDIVAALLESIEFDA